MTVQPSPGPTAGERPVGLILLVVGVLVLVGIRLYHGIHTPRGIGTPQEMAGFVVVAAGSVASLVAIVTVLSFRTSDLGKLANHQTPIVIGLLVSLVFGGFAVVQAFGGP
jgi:uncharacterized membrane protein